MPDEQAETAALEGCDPSVGESGHLRAAHLGAGSNEFVDSLIDRGQRGMRGTLIEDFGRLWLLEAERKRGRRSRRWGLGECRLIFADDRVQGTTPWAKQAQKCRRSR